MGSQESNELGLFHLINIIKNIKLWEKELDDFLKPINHNLVKCKLLAESRELTGVKQVDVGAKAQIVRVQENIHNGRFNVLICVANHNTNEVDLFDIEMMSM